MMDGLIRYEEYSHTDLRQMLTITAGPFRTSGELLRAPDTTSKGVTKIGRLMLASAMNLEAVVHTEHPLWDHIRAGGNSLPFNKLAVSWSKRAPSRLKVHSRPMMMALHALDLAEFEGELPENKSRTMYVLETLEDINAPLNRYHLESAC